MSGFTLKLIAIIAMLIDHTAGAFNLGLDIYIGSSDLSVYYLMRIIGRIAFPIFAFFIAEGCLKTSNIWKYGGRLFVFGLISEVPFQYALNIYPGMQIFRISFSNIYFTFTLAVLVLGLWQILKGKVGKPLRVVILIVSLFAAFWIAETLDTDYGYLGIMFVVAIYFARPKKWLWILLMVILAAVLYPPSTLINTAILAGALVPIVLLGFYNGQRGVQIKYAFYGFYPVHLAILAAIKHLM